MGSKNAHLAIKFYAFSFQTIPDSRETANDNNSKKKTHTYTFKEIMTKDGQINERAVIKVSMFIALCKFVFSIIKQYSTASWCKVRAEPLSRYIKRFETIVVDFVLAKFLKEITSGKFPASPMPILSLFLLSFSTYMSLCVNTITVTESVVIFRIFELNK